MNLTLNSLISFLLILLPDRPDANFESYYLQIPGSLEKVNFVAISGGKFIMGNNAISSQAPEHVAIVSDFWMSTHEITWQQYELFIRRNERTEKFSDVSELKSLGIDGVSSATQPYTDMSFGMGKDGYPAVNITQYAAISYCKWLSALTGQFYRLPTEAEWEYAARGGKYNDGDELLKKLDDYAWHKGNSGSKYHKVGSLKPNALGLYDILGNASEWTMDGYAPYSENTPKDYWRIPEKLYPRVVRGGSWMDEKSKITYSYRTESKPEWKIRDPQLPKSRYWHTNAPFVGFRIVRPRIQPTPGKINKYWLKIFEDYN